MAYTSTTQIASALDKALTAEQTAYFTSTLSDSIDGYIDSETETSFGQTTPADVYVSGDGSGVLMIPTMYDITAVEDEYGNVIPTTAYVEHPRGDGETFALRRKSGGSWNEGVENYTVKGTLGYKLVPATISAIATEIAINHFNGLTAASNGVKSEKVGDWSATYQNTEISMSTRSISTLTSYRRLSRSI